jgi:hypothetical protein
LCVGHAYAAARELNPKDDGGRAEPWLRRS